MAKTYSSLNIHYVFSTKSRAPLITSSVQDRLWSYMGGIAHDNKIKPLCIGGMPDHIHLLASLPTTVSIAQAIKLIKGGSSAWLHATFPEAHAFAWQEGYGAFSVSISHLPETIAYIQNQAAHHKTKSFQDEYRAFLQKHAIPYDEKYVWD